MSTLHINLNKKRFLEVLREQNKTEYLEINDFYIKRLFNYKDRLNISGVHPITEFSILLMQSKDSSLIDLYLKDFDTITFSNGAGKDRPKFIIELNDVYIGFNEHGILCKKYFVLSLGCILSKFNF